MNATDWTQDIFPNLMELNNLTSTIDPNDLLSGLCEEDMASIATGGKDIINYCLSERAT